MLNIVRAIKVIDLYREKALSDRGGTKKSIPFTIQLWYKVASGELSFVRRILGKTIPYLPLFFVWYL